MEIFKFEKESGAFRETNSHYRSARSVVERTAGDTTTESAMKKRQCVKNHRLHKREDFATRAKAGGEASLDLRVTRSEREPHGTCQKPVNIIGSLDSARKESASTSSTTSRERCEEAPVKREPPVEGARRVRYHSISRERLEPGVERERFHDPA